jgi:hypothetical protein
MAFITSDNVVRSAPMQFLIGNNLAFLQKHLNALSQNFDDLKLIALYDRAGQLFLATDYELAPGRVDLATALNLKDRKYEIFYVPDYNQYVMSVTAPLMNQFSLRIGYFRTFFTMRSLLAKLRLGRDFRLFLARDGTVIPMSAEGSTTGIEPGRGEGIAAIRQDGVLWTAKYQRADDSGLRFVVLYRTYNGLFLLIAVVNVLLALLLAGLFIAFTAGLRRTKADQAFRATADEVLTYTQKTLREVHVLDDMVSELKQQKEDLRTRIDRLQADGGTASAKGTYEFKVIEPL